MKYLLFTLSLVASTAAADPVVIEDIRATQSGQTWRFDVTVSHPDTGWDHYADGWRVEDADGNELGMRVLAHPHVNEQPFTRSLTGMSLPEGVDTVFIRARCNIDGWNASATEFKLP